MTTPTRASAGALEEFATIQRRAATLRHTASSPHGSFNELRDGLEALAGDLAEMVAARLDDVDTVRRLQATRAQLGGHLLAAADLVAVGMPTARARSLLQRAATAVETGIASALVELVVTGGSAPSASAQGWIGSHP